MVFNNTLGKQTSTFVMQALLVLSVLIPLIILMQSGDGLLDMMRLDAPKGQLIYISSKLFALCAFLLLWLQLIMGLLQRVSKRVHVFIGIVLITFVIMHISLFIMAVSVRSGEFAYQILLPSFFSGYYKSALSIGVLALIFMLVSVTAGILRKRITIRWRIGHRFVLIMFALVVAHSLMIGSEMQSGLFLYLLYFSIFSLASAVLLKLTGFTNHIKQSVK